MVDVPSDPSPPPPPPLRPGLLCLSTPPSVRASPVVVPLGRGSSLGDMHSSSLMSPSSARRQRHFSNYPGPGTYFGAPSAAPPQPGADGYAAGASYGAAPAGYYGGRPGLGDGYAGPSSLPAGSQFGGYMSAMYDDGAGAAWDGYPTQQQAQMHGQQRLHTARMNRGADPGRGRPPLTRQHRSLDAAEYAPIDPQLQPAATTVFPASHSGLNLGQQQQQAPLSVSTGSGTLAFGPRSNPSSGHVNWQAMDSAPASNVGQFVRDPYSMPVPVLQREFETLRREYEGTLHKLHSTMHSIKTFWSPELKKERSARKDEANRMSALTEQLRMATSEHQKQSTAIRQLQNELQYQYDVHRTIRDTDVQSVPRDEYDALRLERDRLHRELQMARDTVRELEVQIETQRQTLVSRDDSIKKLLDMLQGKGVIPYNAAQERAELEQCRGRVIEAETRGRHIEATLSQRDQDVRSLQEECLSASDKLRQMQLQLDRAQAMAPAGQRADGSVQNLIDNKESRIHHLERQARMYEDEMRRLREERLSAPRDFTERNVSMHEMQDMKLKVEKGELELAHRATEAAALHTRLAAAEEQVADYKKHLELVREANSAKDQQATLLQSDVDALRKKLELKNESLEQKQTQLNQHQMDAGRLNGELADLNEQIKIRDSKLTMQQRKVAGLEELVSEKEREAEELRQRMQNLPAVQQQRQIQDQLEEMIRERDRIGREMRQQCDKMEAERLEQLDAHRREVRNLKSAIDNLQKEIADRQVLIESQNEKIADLTRELHALRIAKLASLSELGESSELDRLTQELDQARAECHRLLQMVQTHSKERDDLNQRLKQAQRQLEEWRRSNPAASSAGGGSAMGGGSTDSLSRRVTDMSAKQKELRIDELEEALRESVSITAEREMAIAQQKQLAQQLEHKMSEYRDQLNSTQRQYEELSGRVGQLSHEAQDKDGAIRSLKKERRQHLEEVLQLKQEALLAAISEKDAHIALLETSPQPSADELRTLKRHKDKLMRRLKDEVHPMSSLEAPRTGVQNERRVHLLNRAEQSDAEQQSTLVAAGKQLKNSSTAEQLWSSLRWTELQKKKLRVLIDQLIACMLEVDADLLTGVPRTQQPARLPVDAHMARRLGHDQLLLELEQRETDSLQLQSYANELLRRLAPSQPRLVRRALQLLGSFQSRPSAAASSPSAGELSA